MPLIQNKISKYGIATTFTIVVPTQANVFGFTSAVPGWVVGDFRISIDGGAVVNTTNLPTQITAANAMYALALTAAELEGHRITVVGKDTSNTAHHIALSIETDPMPDTLFRGTAAAGGASTITLPATGLDGIAASAVDDFYSETAITIIGKTGARQTRVISDYVGATKVATVSRPWTTAPNNTSVFVIHRGADVWDQLHGSEPAPGAYILSNTAHTMRKLIQMIFAFIYHNVTQDNNEQKIYKADDTTLLTTMAVDVDGTTITKGKST